MAGPLLAVSTVAVVWLTVGLVATVAVLAMLVALVRHGLLIGRSVRRMNDEFAPLLAEIQVRGPSGARGAGGRSRPPRT
ncbi:MAG TPA: hypothetical protein VFT27_05525 [Actinomycetota bacterium]|nr:hypothetical protein [Actinomycetota bacterium]